MDVGFHTEQLHGIAELCSGTAQSDQRALNSPWALPLTVEGTVPSSNPVFCPKSELYGLDHIAFNLRETTPRQNITRLLRASPGCSAPRVAQGPCQTHWERGAGSAQASWNTGVGKMLLSALVLRTFSVGKGHGTAASSTDPDGLFRQEGCCLSYIRTSLVSWDMQAS